MIITKKNILKILTVLIIFTLFFAIKIPRVSADSYCSGNTKVVSTSYFPCCGNPATACGGGASGCDDQNRCTWSHELQQYPGTTCYSYDYTTCDCGCSNGSCNPCPVCGNGNIEAGENCDPSGSGCTDGGKNGTCTSSCLCCVRCSVQCPVPLVETQPSGTPRPLSEYTFEDIVSCQDGTGCSEPRDHPLDCYEVPSPQPTVGLTIHPEVVSTPLSFTSNTHTGGGLYATDKDDSVNDFFPYSSERYPNSDNLFYMDATFNDADYPIESAYVWFNKSGIKPITPQLIDLDNTETPQKYGTNSQEAFGFLLHNISGVWTPYIPAISGVGNSQTDLWKQASNGYLETVEGKSLISIPGTSGIIAEVLIYSVETSNNGKTVKVRFSISFKEDGDTPLSNLPAQGNYKIWLMGNDSFGFTPYDNYEDKETVVKNAVHNKWISYERIRYFDQWVNTSQSWNLNFKSPGINFPIKPSESSPVGIDINWDFIPDPDLPDEFSSLVINVYKTENLTIDPIIISGINNGGASSVDINNNFVVEENGKSSDIVGSLNKSVNHYLLKIVGGSGDGSATLTLNNVGQGKLFFTVTAFDKGGNIGSVSLFELDLRDWLITQGGLLYSNSIDINVNHGNLPTGWDTKNLLKNILHQYADVSTELVGLRGSGIPVAPSKSGNTKSYMIRPFSTPDPTKGYYVSLKETFSRKKSNLSSTIKSLTSSSTISGSLSSTYGVDQSQIAVMERTGDLTVTNNFVCDRQGVFFVSGSLTIDGKIANGNVNKDACIFVVGNIVTIGQGNTFPGNQLEYDEVNAYIFADGKISIEKDESDYNGLYISGGIHSLSSTGVLFGRSLKVADRLRFPALVVNHHSKYGILGGRLFGQGVLVQLTEVGLKPY